MPHYTKDNAGVPFPKDVPVAAFARISLSELRSGNEAASSTLFKACKEDGFFLLDLQDDPQGEDLLDHAGRVFEVGETLFDLPYEVKMKHVMGGPRHIFGYKGIGLSKVDSEGTPDRCEFYGISKNDLLGITPPLSGPSIMHENRERFKSFASEGHTLSLFILSHIERHLHLPHGTMASMHRVAEPSGDQVRVLKYDPQPNDDRRTSLVPHTDFGTMTILFNILGGLQVLPIGKNDVEENWKYVKPRAGCAIINLGDSMTKWTNGLLKSAMHRVTYAPGKQAGCTRWSLAYFNHPEDRCLMKRIEGSDVIPPLGEGDVEEDITAEDWTTAGSTRLKQDGLKDFEKMVGKGPVQVGDDSMPFD